MFRGFRQSKYRHVYYDEPKQDECWTGFRLSTQAGDQQFIKASAKYFSVSLAGGGGPVGIFDLERPGKYTIGTCPMLAGHTGGVIDFDWNPFNDSMLATCSEDSTIKIWSIPEEWKGMQPGDEREVMSESLLTLEEHKKKVTNVSFNPTVNNVLATASADDTIKVWDIEKSCSISSYNEIEELSQDLVWDVKGDNFASSNKDKTIRIFDARTASVTGTIPLAHEGIKHVKLTYLGESGKLLSVGSSKQSSREVKIWDLKDLSNPLKVHKIDNGAGVIFPLFDLDTNVLYLCGKGDGNIRIYEFEDKGEYVFSLSTIRSTIPTRGICMVPKRGLNIMGCETARLLKVSTSGVIPLCMTVPRKSEAFQEDLFPDCPAPVAAHSADEWLTGSSKSPVTMSCNPADRKDLPSSVTNSGTFKVVTVKSLSKELDEARERIEYLELKLKENDIQY